MAEKSRIVCRDAHGVQPRIGETVFSDPHHVVLEIFGSRREWNSGTECEVGDDTPSLRSGLLEVDVENVTEELKKDDF